MIVAETGVRDIYHGGSRSRSRDRGGVAKTAATIAGATVAVATVAFVSSHISEITLHIPAAKAADSAAADKTLTTAMQCAFSMASTAGNN